MIEVDFFGKDRPTCDVCRKGAVIHIAIDGNTRLPSKSMWFCEDHLKELYEKIDPLRVLIMTGENIK